MASLIEDALDGIEALVARVRESVVQKPAVYPVRGTTTSNPVASESQPEPETTPAAVPESELEAAPVEEAPVEAEPVAPSEGPEIDPAGPAAGDVPEEAAPPEADEITASN